MMMLDYLQTKDKGLMILDAFAGIGLYQLDSYAANRTKEYQLGIQQVMEAQFENNDLIKFQKFMKLAWDGRQYFGSPLIAAHLARPQDRLVLNELHPEDVDMLRHNLQGFKRVQITSQDAYVSIRASIPPTEKRGLVLIDPPFEKPDEFEILVSHMEEWKKRWPTGVYALWYPIKSQASVNDLHRAGQNLGLNNTCVSEVFLEADPDKQGLSGAGMIIFNGPYDLLDKLNNMSAELSKALSLSKFDNRVLVQV
jgi:23S rRNA (adenine2030-N6)-methyltransferase